MNGPIPLPAAPCTGPGAQQPGNPASGENGPARLTGSHRCPSRGPSAKECPDSALRAARLSAAEGLGPPKSPNPGQTGRFRTIRSRKHPRIRPWKLFSSLHPTSTPRKKLRSPLTSLASPSPELAVSPGLRSDTTSRSHPDCRLATPPFSLRFARRPKIKLPWSHYPRSSNGATPTDVYTLFAPTSRRAAGSTATDAARARWRRLNALARSAETSETTCSGTAPRRPSRHGVVTTGGQSWS